MSKETLSPEEIVLRHEERGKYLEVDGIRTFVLDEGTGEAVLCLHGVPTSSFLYRKVVTALVEKNYRAVAIDLPGLGLSSRPEDFDYSFPGFSRFLVKAANALDITRFHLVVHDIGGPIGFHLAANHPPRILSLTILNTWIDVVNFKKPMVMRGFENKFLGEAELKMITHNTWPIMFSKMGVNNGDLIPEEEQKAYVDLLKREDGGKAFLKIMRSFEDSPSFRDKCYEAVKQVPYPMQVIWGSDDPALTYQRYGQEIQDKAGLTSISLLPARHFLQEEVWQEIADHVDKLAIKARSKVR